MLGAALVLGSLKPWPIGIKVSGLADDESSGAKVLSSLVRRRWELNPQDPGRESADYKSAGLDHMPNFSVSKNADAGGGFRTHVIRSKGGCPSPLDDTGAGKTGVRGQDRTGGGGMLPRCLTNLATRTLDKIVSKTKVPKVPQKQFDGVLAKPLRQPPTIRHPKNSR
jgi:hypothetical protein